MHYTELCARLKSDGFNAAIFDDETIVGNKPRIYLNGYGPKSKVYLFFDPVRRQNNFQNPIGGYGLHVNEDVIMEAKEKMLARCFLKHKVMTDLFEKGYALKPVSNFKVISL